MPSGLPGTEVAKLPAQEVAIMARKHDIKERQESTEQPHQAQESGRHTRRPDQGRGKTLLTPQGYAVYL
jgi:hypothetical protein